MVWLWLTLLVVILVVWKVVLCMVLTENRGKPDQMMLRLVMSPLTMVMPIGFLMVMAVLPMFSVVSLK